MRETFVDARIMLQEISRAQRSTALIWEENKLPYSCELSTTYVKSHIHRGVDEFILVKQGAVVLKAEDQEFLLRSSQLCLIPEGCAHSIFPDREGLKTSYYVIDVPVKLRNLLVESLYIPSTIVATLCRSKIDVWSIGLNDIQSLGWTLSLFLQEKSAISNLTLLFTSIILTIYAKYIDVSKHTEHFLSHPPSWFRDFYETLHHPKVFQYAISELINRESHSRNYIYECFKRYLQETPSHCFNQIRINYASELLASTETSILEIALIAGYANLGYFYKQFRLLTGMSPQVYRNIHQKQ